MALLLQVVTQAVQSAQAAQIAASVRAERTWLDVLLSLSGVLSTVFSALLMWVVWSFKKVVVPRAEFEEHERNTKACYDGADRRMSGMDRRIDGVVRDVQEAVREVTATAKGMLTREEAANLRIAIERANGSTNTLGAQLEGANRVLDETRKLVGFINRHMIEEARK